MVPGVFWTRVSGLRDIRGNRTSAGGLTPAALGVVPTGLAWVANLPRAYALGYPLPPLRGSLTSALRGTLMSALRVFITPVRGSGWHERIFVGSRRDKNVHPSQLARDHRPIFASGVPIKLTRRFPRRQSFRALSPLSGVFCR